MHLTVLALIVATALMFPLAPVPGQQWPTAPLGPPPGGSPGPPSPNNSTTDPTGDTFGTLVPQLDITFFSAFTDGFDLTISMNFAGTISPPGSGNPDELVGFIDLDTDQNPSTGGIATTDVFCPSPSGLGADYTVQINGTVTDAGGNPTGTATTTFTANTYSVRIPLTLLGGDEGIADTATVIGTIPEPTDCAPNGGFITSSAPAAPTLPAMMAGALFLLLLVAGTIALRRRRARMVEIA